MKAVFYDRKNRQEVSNEQLMSINFVRSFAAVDDEGFPPGTPIQTLVDKYGPETVVIATEQIGSLGYKSKNSSPHCNWDLWCNESDLIFLRME